MGRSRTARPGAASSDDPGDKTQVMRVGDGSHEGGRWEMDRMLQRWLMRCGQGQDQREMHGHRTHRFVTCSHRDEDHTFNFFHSFRGHDGYAEQVMLIINFKNVSL